MALSPEAEAGVLAVGAPVDDKTAGAVVRFV